MPKRTGLPRLRWDGDGWSGRIELPSWAGFQVRSGAYGARDKATKRNKLRICFMAPSNGDDDLERRRPSEEQVAAYTYLLDHDGQVTKAVLTRMLREYPKLRAAYHNDYDIDPDADDRADEHDLFGDLKPLPEIKRSADLRKVMGLATIHVLDVAKAGVSYVGFEFGCDWDDEHGAGMMLHKRRIVKFGSADVSFLEWIAERDGGHRIS